MALNKIIEKQVKIFKKKFIVEYFKTRTIDGVEYQYGLDDIDDIEAFLRQAIRQAVEEALEEVEKTIGNTPWDELPDASIYNIEDNLRQIIKNKMEELNVKP